MTLIIRTTGMEDYLDGGEGRVKCLVMGPPGAGKTRSSSFWPKPLLLDCEDGRMSVADRSLPYFRVRTSAEMKAMLDMLVLESQKPPLERRFLTLIIDTLDSYQRIVMQERLKATGNESFSGWADWGYLDSRMQLLVQRVQDLSMNVVVNLHVKQEKIDEDEDGKGGMIILNPKLKGDLRDQISAEFDLVGHMGTFFEGEKGERIQKRGIQWHATPDRPWLKDRSGTLPKYTDVAFTDRDYYGLFEALAAKVDELKDSEVVGEVAMEAAPQPVAPLEGGPVAAKPVKAAAAKKTAAAPPAAVAPQVSTPVGSTKSAAAPAGPAAPLDAAPTTAPGQAPIPAAPAASPRAVPAAAKPVIPGASSAPVAAPAAPAEPVVAEPVAAEPEPTVEEAVETVAEALGGEVISESAPADEQVVAPAPNPPMVIDLPTATVEADAPDATASASQGEWPACGDPKDPDSEATVPGCGKVLRVSINEKGSYSTDDPTENADLIEIAVLKSRTWLCNNDFAAYRAAATKEN